MQNLPDIVLDRYVPIYRHVADISADIWDEIFDIPVDIVTYLGNYYFFAWEIIFFILCSLWYFNDVFIWCLDNNLFLLIMSYMFWLLIYQPVFSIISRYMTRFRYLIYNFVYRYIADTWYLKLSLHQNSEVVGKG